jgi:hypothetical protein
MNMREKSFLTQLEQAHSPRREDPAPKINAEALDSRINELKDKIESLE